MKIKKFTIVSKEIKGRQPFAPVQRRIESKKSYNRRDFKLDSSW
jgi:hypothetical protein